jgi:SAM-dependent methyltransferase
MTNLKKLNLGCGRNKKEGFVNVDWDKLNSPDIVVDLNEYPYPFEDNSFDYIEAFHILEHLNKPFKTMGELRRILKKDGIVKIKVPHFSRGFTHTEHSHGFDVTLPIYFDEDLNVSGYYGISFKLMSLKLNWSAFADNMRFFGYGNISITLVKTINHLINFLANLSPTFCSRIWCFYVGGFEEIEYIFRKK